MVSSRSSRGRVSLRSDHQSQLEHDHDSSRTSSPVTATTITSIHDHDATLLQSQPQKPVRHDNAGSSRAKRNRIVSISDRESLQKRRKLSGNRAVQVHIPLRGKAAAAAADVLAYHGNVLSRNTAVAPPLATHDSSISNSPLNSPSCKPQYDQFRRIEEKAQKLARKNAAHDDKRKLRSEHGSTRSKTELAQYFPNFDDLLSLEPVDPNTLTAKTRIVLIDDTPQFRPSLPQLDYFRSKQPPHNSEVVNLEQYAKPTPSDDDPLSDSVYLKAHQKAERHEKQMKNGDKERAQHEKYQLERLLEELRGPDWLKTLGISGITDTEKKRYEVKRSLFIRETKALIEKFRRWKEEEKRRKLEKQQALLEEAEADIEAERPDAGANSSSLTTTKKTRIRTRNGTTSSKTRSRTNSLPISNQHKHVDSPELDALAAQQLLEEAKLANTQRHKANGTITAYFQSQSVPVPPPEIPSTKPFTSFFEKRHIRDAAVLGRNRGRKTYAFGLEVPELEDGEFELPEGILTEDSIRARQRNRRRVTRGEEI